MVGEIFDKDEVSLDAARHPRQIVHIYSDYEFEIKAQNHFKRRSDNDGNMRASALPLFFSLF